MGVGVGLGLELEGHFGGGVEGGGLVGTGRYCGEGMWLLERFTPRPYAPSKRMVPWSTLDLVA